MYTYTIDLGVSVSNDYQEDVCDRLSYAHSGIVEIIIDPNDNRHVQVIASEQLEIDELQPVMANSAKEMLKKGLEGVHIILKDRRDKVSDIPTKSAFQALVDNGWLIATSRGSFAKRGPVLNLLNHLDAKFREIAIDLGAEDIELSSFMSVETLHKAGHFNASPQHITFATHLSEDIEYLKEMAEEAQQCSHVSTLEDKMKDHYVGQGVTLAPAVCYNYYATLENSVIEQLKVVTAMNKCYRYEAGRLEGLARLWEFRMREVIFVGPAKQVEEKRMQSLDAVWAFAESLGLHAWVENANDPFFIGEFDSRASFQRNRKMKYELRLTVAGDFSVAATSFNMHSTTFGQKFNLSLSNGRPACSACCAWGEERWVLALFSQFGLEASQWPEELRDIVWN